MISHLFSDHSKDFIRKISKRNHLGSHPRESFCVMEILNIRLPADRSTKCKDIIWDSSSKGGFMDEMSHLYCITMPGRQPHLRKFDVDSGEDIPSIVNNQIKCLGNWFDVILYDSNNSRRLHIRKDFELVHSKVMPPKRGSFPRLT